MDSKGYYEKVSDRNEEIIGYWRNASIIKWQRM